MTLTLIYLSAFIGVAALVGGVAFLLRGDTSEEMTERLAQLTSASKGKQNSQLLNQSVLSSPLDEGKGLLIQLFDRFNLTRLFSQADTSLTIPKFVAMTGAMAGMGAVIPIAIDMNPMWIPVTAFGMGAMPLMWLTLRRRRRLKQFAKQLPDALELMSRALRAGHSLGAGFNLVSEEMTAPLGPEFRRVFEEQNLGITLDDALDGLTERVPNLDLKFFATAVILQRQTGGDLAEILDKIGYLVRERFKIWGQVQALTGEGRLSGVVLLGLPPALFAAVYRLNPDYVMPLFYDPLGKKMLAGGAIMQLLGAIVIRKIVNIKV